MPIVGLVILAQVRLSGVSEIRPATGHDRRTLPAPEVARAMRGAGPMRSWLAFPCGVSLLTALVSISSSGCLDTPPETGAATARLVTSWDPLACGDPHRVVVELEDDGGARLSASTPCNIGGLTLDVLHLGSYHGRVYAWALGAPIRSITAIAVMIDQPIVNLQVSTPP